MAEFVVLGNPGSERVESFQLALVRGGRPPARVVAWEEVLTGRDRVERHLAPGTLLRIESPGENPRVERLLLARGADLEDERFVTPRLSAAACLALPEDRGRILLPRQHFLGFRRALLDLVPDAPVLNAPKDLALLADKPSAHERLVAAGVPRPRVLGCPRSFDELQELLRSSRCFRVFVKLANGSSASGVAAYQTDGRRHLAITSAEFVRENGEGRLYNSKRIRRYSALDDVRMLLDALCREGVLVESWIPKASLGGRAFDLRVVVVAGRARHVVVRLSPTPLTNLHLGSANRREDPARAKALVGDDAWREALDACERAAAAFPGCLYGGVDLLLGSRSHRPFVAEVNAFGDLLRRTLHEGKDPYEAEIEEALEAVR